MMMNLFSIFDPSTSSFSSLNWLSMFICLLPLPYMFWVIPSRPQMMALKMFKFLLKEFNPLIPYSKSNFILFSSMFFFIMMNNVSSLIPYIFTATSHLSLSLSLSLSMWAGMMIYGWTNFFQHMLSHLTPTGTPWALMPIMVIIELISLTIRPLTLSIRLTANMIAGHLLLSLLSSSGTLMNLPMMILLIIPSQFMLLTLEISVSLIQAYVFSILSALYSTEI